MISLAECAPCKAMRLKEEAEVEFRERYGFINLTPPTWRPYMGQLEAVFPAAASASPAPASDDYIENVGERMLWFGTGALIGLPVGILWNVAFKSARHYREEAKTFVLLAAGAGMLAAFLPFPRNEIQNIAARVSGILMGSGLRDVVLPKPSTVTAMVKG